jgi:hypothetical protein
MRAEVRFEEEPMNRWTRFLLCLLTSQFLATALLLPACSGCEEEDDEKALVGMINKAADLAAAHELGELMAMTTDDFVARPGHRTRQEVKGILLMAFRRYGEFSVEHPAPSVEVSPSALTATADLPFLIVRKGVELPDLSDLYEDPQGWVEAVGEKADAYHSKLSFRKTDDGWRVEKVKIQGTRGVGGFRGL